MAEELNVNVVEKTDKVGENNEVFGFIRFILYVLCCKCLIPLGGSRAPLISHLGALYFIFSSTPTQHPHEEEPVIRRDAPCEPQGSVGGENGKKHVLLSGVC